jgi:hypothetical protein
MLQIKVIPDRLSISIGGHFGPSFSIALEGDSVTYTQAKRRQEDAWEFAPSGSENS